MERARRGSRPRFLYFWRVLVWLNRTNSPSQPNHTGLLWGSPRGPRVAMWARAVLSSKSRWLSGTRVFSGVTRSPCRGFVCSRLRNGIPFGGTDGFIETSRYRLQEHVGNEAPSAGDVPQQVVNCRFRGCCVRATIV